MKPWHKKGFPLYNELATLVDGSVATGDTAFRPGRMINDHDIDPLLRDEETALTVSLLCINA